MNDRQENSTSRLKKFFLHDLWQLELERFSRLRAFLYRSIRLAYLIGKEFVRDQLLVQAGSLVYSTLFAIVPFLAVLFYTTKAFRYQYLVETLLDLMLRPLGDQIKSIVIPRILQLVNNANLNTIGFIGFVFLIFSLIGILFTVEQSFNHIWCHRQSRGWKERFLSYSFLGLIGPVMLISIIGMTTYWQSSVYIETVRELTWLKSLLQKAFPLLLVWGMIFMVIWIMPGAKVRARSALIGSMISGTLLHLGNLGISRYLVTTYESGSQAAIYAGLAALPLLLFWLYFGWCAVLLASEIAFAHQHLRRLVLEEKSKRLSFVFEEGIALRILLLIGRAHQSQQRMPTAESLSMAMEIPEAMVEDLLQLFIRKRIVRRIDGEPERFGLLIEPAQLRISEVVLALRQSSEEASMLQLPLSVKIIQLQSRINGAIERAVEDLTLADLCK